MCEQKLEKLLEEKTWEKNISDLGFGKDFK